MTKDDYENYYPADDRWSKKKIAVDYSYSTEILGKYKTMKDFKSEVHFSDETKKKINGFLKCKEDRHVIYAINEAEENIERKKRIEKLIMQRRK